METRLEDLASRLFRLEHWPNCGTQGRQGGCAEALATDPSLCALPIEEIDILADAERLAQLDLMILEVGSLDD